MKEIAFVMPVMPVMQEEGYDHFRSGWCSCIQLLAF